jgi:hypothetical protein
VRAPKTISSQLGIDARPLRPTRPCGPVEFGGALAGTELDGELAGTELDGAEVDAPGVGWPLGASVG